MSSHFPAPLNARDNCAHTKLDRPRFRDLLCDLESFYRFASPENYLITSSQYFANIQGRNSLFSLPRSASYFFLYFVQEEISKPISFRVVILAYCAVSTIRDFSSCLPILIGKSPSLVKHLLLDYPIFKVKQRVRETAKDSREAHFVYYFFILSLWKQIFMSAESSEFHKLTYKVKYFQQKLLRHNGPKQRARRKEAKLMVYYVHINRKWSEETSAKRLEKPVESFSFCFFFFNFFRLLLL